MPPDARHSDALQRHRAESRFVTLAGMLANFSLSALKLFIGVAASSQALVADALHSLSDTATDLAILLGIRFWSAPADDCHPYGHWRIESLITVAIAVMLAGAAITMGFHAIDSVRDPPAGSPGGGALIAALISIAVKEGLFRWTLSVGKRIRSSAVVANAWHHRSDALSSVTVAVAVIVALVRPTWSYVDAIGAVIVGVFILHAAWMIARGALGDLMDRGASFTQRQNIEALAARVDGVEGVHAVRARRLGPGLFVDLHITVHGEMSVRVGHDISEEVKHRLVAEGPDVLDVIVHLEPAHDEPAHDEPAHNEKPADNEAAGPPL